MEVGIVTVPDPLAPIRARAEGLTDLCPEHLGESIRHIRRNCEIDCNVHDADPEGGDCKQPGRYDGDRMARVLADVPALLAALDAVMAIHKPITVYALDPDGGELNEDQVMAVLCHACTGDSVLEAIGDCEYDPTDYHDETPWPCPTVAAVSAALGGGE